MYSLRLLYQDLVCISSLFHSSLFLGSTQASLVGLDLDALGFAADLEVVADRGSLWRDIFGVATLRNSGVVSRRQDVISDTDLEVCEGLHDVAADRDGLEQRSADDIGFLVTLVRPDTLLVLVEDMIDGSLLVRPLLVQCDSHGRSILANDLYGRILRWKIGFSNHLEKFHVIGTRRDVNGIIIIVFSECL